MIVRGSKERLFACVQGITSNHQIGSDDRPSLWSKRQNGGGTFAVPTATGGRGRLEEEDSTDIFEGGRGGEGEGEGEGLEGDEKLDVLRKAAKAAQDYINRDRTSTLASWSQASRVRAHLLGCTKLIIIIRIYGQKRVNLKPIIVG
jgi:hypothetical protein